MSKESQSLAQREEFLRLLADGCTVVQASAGVGVDRRTVYRWREAEPEFAKAWDEAQRIRLDQLVQEAERRAMSGSDKLLMFLMCNYAPERFRSPTARVELTGANGGPVELTDTERAAKLAGLIALAEARKAAEEAGGDLV